MVGTKTLANTFSNYVKTLPQDSVIAKAHATLSKGMVVELTLATGVTSAPSANDRAGFFAVAAEDVAKDAIGKFIVDGYAQFLSGALIGSGLIVEPNATMKVTALTKPADGDGFARVIEGASAANKLVWGKIL